jgi:hypothetical protein
VRIASVSGGETLGSRPGRMSGSSGTRAMPCSPLGVAVLDFNVQLHVIVLFRIYP